MRIRLASSIDKRSRAETIREFILALARHNLVWYRQQCVPTLIYGTVKYRRSQNDDWLDYPSLLFEGAGDCEDLVAARLAELWYIGVDAQPLVEWQYPTNDWHITILLPDGKIEDPSAIVYA